MSIGQCLRNYILQGANRGNSWSIPILCHPKCTFLLLENGGLDSCVFKGVLRQECTVATGTICSILSSRKQPLNCSQRDGKEMQAQPRSSKNNVPPHPSIVHRSLTPIATWSRTFFIHPSVDTQRHCHALSLDQVPKNPVIGSKVAKQHSRKLGSTR